MCDWIADPTLCQTKLLKTNSTKSAELLMEEKEGSACVDMIVPSLHGCSSKQRWYSTDQYHLLYHLLSMGKVGQGLSVRPSSMVQCHLHLTLGPSRRPPLLAFNSLPFLVSAHCCLFLVSRPCAAHCCRLFLIVAAFFSHPP